MHGTWGHTEIVEIAYSHYKGSVCTRSSNMGLTSAEGKSWSVLKKRQLIFLSTKKSSSKVMLVKTFPRLSLCL